MAHPEQQENLERVSRSIAPTILAFLRGLKPRGIVLFHAEELRRVVNQTCGTAPASADRVLRDLRRKRRVAYEVENRRRSLYRLVDVECSRCNKMPCECW